MINACRSLDESGRVWPPCSSASFQLHESMSTSQFESHKRQHLEVIVSARKMPALLSCFDPLNRGQKETCPTSLAVYVHRRAEPVLQKPSSFLSLGSSENNASCEFWKAWGPLPAGVNLASRLTAIEGSHHHGCQHQTLTFPCRPGCQLQQLQMPRWRWQLIMHS